MNQEISLSLAALIVALVALINTIGQVLQQYYATADGYRRCSPSVMGEWARFTRRRFVWKEFRFETMFATPVIFLDVAYDLKAAADHSSLIVLDGTHEMDEWPGLKTGKIKIHSMAPRWSVFGHEHHWHNGRSTEEPKKAKRSRTLSSTGIKQFLRTNTPLISPETQLQRFLRLDNDPKGEHAENLPVTWIPLMRSLQQYSSSLRLCGLSVLQDSSSGSLRRGRVLAPAIRVSKKSWDFMPADLVKPLALSNVRDVATIAQYLGCRWTNFKPEESILRAEGAGIMVTSTEMKSFGTVINFIKTDDRSDDRRHLHGIAFSPLEGAATLGFGIISSDFLGGESYKVYDLEDCQATIGYLSNSIQNPEGLPTAIMETIITDLIGILTPIYRPFSTGITYVVKPSAFVSANVASLQGNLVYFLAELRDLLESKQSSTQEDYGPLRARLYEAEAFLARSKWNAVLGRPVVAYRGYADPKVINLLDNLQQSWESSSGFLAQYPVTSRAVLSWHILTVLDSKQKVLNIQRQMPLRYPENMAAARKQLMHFYFETCRQRCITEVGKTVAPEIVERIWIEMLFRGLMWHAIHNFDEKVVSVPPRYSDSNLPIYIA